MEIGQRAYHGRRPVVVCGKRTIETESLHEKRATTPSVEYRVIGQAGGACWVEEGKLSIHPNFL